MCNRPKPVVYVARYGRCSLLVLVLLWGISFDRAVSAASLKINLWYGHQQSFGRPGLPQRWINILGNVSPAGDLQSLNYSLNGEPVRPLAIGPDHYRLAEPGDFNIDILARDLKIGVNQVVITAVDRWNQPTQARVEVEFVPERTPFLPYSIDWQAAGNIQEVAQVVDGLWAIGPDGVRPLEPGYDRLIAIGDMWWRDYEVTVPVTIHGAEPQFSFPSHGAALSLILRWQGHRRWDERQPAVGWWPLGASGAVVWVNPTDFELRLFGNKDLPMDLTSAPKRLQLNVPYYFKMRAETIPGFVTLYRLKVWEQQMPEPVGWDLQGQQRLWDPLYGAVLLAAHHVDASFGNVTITPISSLSAWELFVALGSYVAQLPLIALGCIGIAFALLQRRHYPFLTRPILISAVLLIAAALGNTYLRQELPLYLQRRAWSTHEIGLVLVAGEAVHSAIMATSVGLLMLTLLRQRRKQHVE